MNIFIEHLTIHQGASARAGHPPITMTSAEFQRGYYSGLKEQQGELAGERVTDKDIIAMLHDLYNDGAFTEESGAVLQFSMGSLIGRIVASL